MTLNSLVNYPYPVGDVLELATVECLVCQSHARGFVDVSAFAKRNWGLCKICTSHLHTCVVYLCLISKGV